MYSQTDEDAVILRAVGTRVGRFLDIGAYDGQRYSNTYALVERGWEGVLVEPGLEAFVGLLKNLGENPKVQLVHAPIVPFGKRVVPFWNNPRTFSTTEESNTRKFHFEGFAPKFWTGGVTFQELLAALPGPVDVLSIDTEGSSVELFEEYFRWIPIRPWVVVVEHDGEVERVREFAALRGYKEIHANPENLIFADRDDQDGGYR